MSFYKMQQGQNEFYFQLANLEPAKEEYVFWKDGQVPPIPIREAISGIMARDAYWDRTGAKQIAGHRADRSYIRDIIVNQGGINTQYLFAFKKRDTEQLNAEISNILNLQRKDPLAFNFKFRKTGQGKETIRVVVAMQEAGLPQNVLQSQIATPLQQSSSALHNAPQSQSAYMQPQQKPTIVPQSVQNPIAPVKVPETSPIKPTSPSQQGIVLGETKELRSISFGVPNEQKVVVLQEGAETEIYHASRNCPEKLTEEKYIELWNDCARKYFNTQFETSRIKDIFNGLYSK